MAPRSEERKMFTLKVFSIYLTEKKYILSICTSKLKKGLIYRYFTIEKNVDLEVIYFKSGILKYFKNYKKV